MFQCLQDEPGGPVNYKNPDGTWTVIGIVSYDQFNSCQNGPSTPRAFTRVSFYLDWILPFINDGNVTCPSTTESITIKTSPITTQSVNFSMTQLTETSLITPPCTSSQKADNGNSSSTIDPYLTTTVNGSTSSSPSTASGSISSSSVPITISSVTSPSQQTNDNGNRTTD